MNELLRKLAQTDFTPISPELVLSANKRVHLLKSLLDKVSKNESLSPEELELKKELNQ